MKQIHIERWNKDIEYYYKRLNFKNQIQQRKKRKVTDACFSYDT